MEQAELVEAEEASDVGAGAADDPSTAADRPLAEKAPAPQKMPAATSLLDVIASGAVSLVDMQWLEESFVERGEPLLPRQELPLDALSPPKSAFSACTRVGFSAISHSWLSSKHPDPMGYRRMAVHIVASLHKWPVFFDYLSIFQPERDRQQEILFEHALSGIAFVFTSRLCSVFRFIDVPGPSYRKKPYADRGWCFFETALASAAAGGLASIHNGHWVEGERSAVPMPPASFERRLKRLEFQHKADSIVVKRLYRELWPSLVRRTWKFWNWTDAEVIEFLAVLPDMETLQEVNMWDAKVSQHMRRRLEDAVSQLNSVVLWC